jgi:hypothetical protein
MVKKGYKAEQVINKLREAEALLSQVGTIAVASRASGAAMRFQSCQGVDVLNRPVMVETGVFVKGRTPRP